MADYEAILKEFDALSSGQSGYVDGLNNQATADRKTNPCLTQIKPDKVEFAPLFSDADYTTETSPPKVGNDEDIQLMDLGCFDESIEALTLENAAQNPEQQWNIVQWLLSSENVPEKKAQPDAMFLPPLPRVINKSRSERSYCSEKSNKSSVTSKSSAVNEKSSALSSVTLDSESEANNTRLRSRKRARKPVRYHAYPVLDGESDSTLAGDVAPSHRPNSQKKTVVKLPRYKRPSHINAEHRRRNKIKTGFEGLDELLPPSNVPGKNSQLCLLTRANEYIRQLHEERSDQNQELEELRLAVHNLNVEISSTQAMLPEDGMEENSPTNNEPSASMDDFFERYVKTQIEDNWKFWIFSYFIRPLFYSYKKVAALDTSTFAELAQRVKDWVGRDMALSLLRPGCLKALCSFSKTSSVMSDPSRLPDEARQAVTRPRLASNYKPTDSGYSSAS